MRNIVKKRDSFFDASRGKKRSKIVFPKKMIMRAIPRMVRQKYVLLSQNSIALTVKIGKSSQITKAQTIREREMSNSVLCLDWRFRIIQLFLIQDSNFGRRHVQFLPRKNWGLSQILSQICTLGRKTAAAHSSL